MTGTFLSEIEAIFPFDQAILFTSKQLEEQIRSRYDQSHAGRYSLVVIDNPFHGAEGYTQAVTDLYNKVMEISDGPSMDGMVINTSGGCEKMSLIIKDLADLLKLQYYTVNIIWGIYNNDTKEVTYTIKPTLEDCRQNIRTSKMPQCPTCNKKFHACTSCSLDYAWESEYCSQICYQTSPQLKDAKDRFIRIWRALTPEERQIFEQLQEIQDNYPQEIQDWKQQV